MRPALQRLLSQPTSLELLRFLVNTAGYLDIHAPAGSIRQCQCRGACQSRGWKNLSMRTWSEGHYASRLSHDDSRLGLPRSPSSRSRGSLRKVKGAIRKYGTVVSFATSENEYGSRSSYEDNEYNSLGSQSPAEDVTIHSPISALHPGSTEYLLGNSALSKSYYGRWKQPNLWTVDQIDFESNLAAPKNPALLRLIDQPQHKRDYQLFARLLDYRERRYGMEGLRMFWEAVKKRRIWLPTRDYRQSKNKGLLAEKLWASFLKLGFYDNQILEELCTYADSLLECEKRRWPRLYATIVEHFLVRGQGNEAVAWHNRLFERHSPSATAFAELCHQTVYQKGDLKALKEIYDKNEHRNAYGKIVLTLCRQGDFKSAKEWHFRLIAGGDIPTKPHHAQALTRFLAIYDRPSAVRVIKSLVAAGAPFDTSNALNENVKISREIMNLVHGKTFNIPVKAYNDEYGARWFATTWVPLDLTMHSVHALGIQEIGPLSLQSLCLRNEPDGSEVNPYSILRRIEQLQSIGISIGTSVFSRAVKHFAQNRMFNYLLGLLKSDQHPDALEDWKSLEALLAHFARIRDWDQYRRILAIRTLGSKAPATEAQNVWLRAHITNRNMHAALETIENMHMNGTVVKTTTIAYIVKAMLQPRPRGRKLGTLSPNLGMATKLLKDIMDAGNLVPAVYWREIVRRIGMMRPNSELRELCIFLATRYGPANELHLSHIGTRRANIHRVPAQVNSSHPLHPLKILFPVSLQKSIVAWGFIQALRKAGTVQPTAMQSQSRRFGHESDINRHVTAGISLLKELHQLGVDIDQQAIKKAIFDRLIVYYSPGTSTKLYNRVGRQHVPKLEVMRQLIDDAMGRRTFSDALKQKIVSRGRVRLIGRARKLRTRDVKRLKSRVFANDRLLL